ncbi:prickle-like protein 2 [Lampetra fluviatilis]
MEKAVGKLAYEMQRNSISDDDSGCALEEYTWVPPGLKPEQVHRYFCCLPEDRVPYVNSSGEKHRIEQLLRQLPPHDNEVRYCSSLGEEEKKELKQFSAQRKREALGRGTVKTFPITALGATCEQCGGGIGGGEMAVFASRAGHTPCWHPACFVCAACRELLVDLIYFFVDGKLYCGRHHAERLKPRCAACDEIIFADECTEAEGRHWHISHFSCVECHVVLGGQRYIMKDGRPFCCSCFQARHTVACESCHQHIGLEEERVTYGGQFWHASDRCFSCARCKSSLLGFPFLPQRSQVFCSKACSLGDDGNASDSADSAFQSARSRDSRRSFRTNAATAATAGTQKPLAIEASGMTAPPAMMMAAPALAVQPMLAPKSSGYSLEAASAQSTLDKLGSAPGFRGFAESPQGTAGAAAAAAAAYGLDQTPKKPQAFLTQRSVASSGGRSSPEAAMGGAGGGAGYRRRASSPAESLGSQASGTKERLLQDPKAVGDYGNPLVDYNPLYGLAKSWQRTEDGPQGGGGGVRQAAYKAAGEMSFLPPLPPGPWIQDGHREGAAAAAFSARELQQHSRLGAAVWGLMDMESGRASPHDSIESLPLSNITGLSVDIDGKSPDQLSKFSLPFVDSECGLGSAEKLSTAGTLNSSSRCRSAESLSGLCSSQRPDRERGRPSELPPLHGDGGGRAGGAVPRPPDRARRSQSQPRFLAQFEPERGAAAAAAAAPMAMPMAMPFPRAPLSERPRRKPMDFDDGRSRASGGSGGGGQHHHSRQRHHSGQHHHGHHHGHHRSRKSRRSRSENALHKLAAVERRRCRFKDEPEVHTHEDYEQLMQRKSGRDGGARGGYPQAPRSIYAPQNHITVERFPNRYPADLALDLDDEGDDSSDDWCSTCSSSSSDSDDDGFFLGQPIPRTVVPVRCQYREGGGGAAALTGTLTGTLAGTMAGTMGYGGQPPHSITMPALSRKQQRRRRNKNCIIS